MSSTPALEVERKFILGGWSASSEPTPIVQGYLTINGSEARVLEVRDGFAVRITGTRPDGGPSESLVTIPPNEASKLVEQADTLGVLPLAPGFEARLRLKGLDITSGVQHGKATLTLKDTPTGQRAVRTEIQCGVTPDAVAHAVAAGEVVGVVKKWRYTEPLVYGDGQPVLAAGTDTPLMAEIDLYSGCGLRIVEVELPPGARPYLDLDRIPVLGIEVTDDLRFSNARIAVDGIPDFVLPNGRNVRSGGGTLPGLELAMAPGSVQRSSANG